MTTTASIALTSAVPTGKGVLLGFSNGVEAFVEAVLLLRLIEVGAAFVITEGSIDELTALSLALPESA